MSSRLKYILVGAAALLTVILIAIIIVTIPGGSGGPPDEAPAATTTPTPEPAPTPRPTTPAVTMPPRTYTVSATAGAGGNIYPCGEIVVDGGDTLTLTIEAAEGYEIDEVTFNGRAVRILDRQSFDYEIQYIMDDHELYVVFSRIELPVTTTTPTPEPTAEPTPVPTRPPASNSDI